MTKELHAPKMTEDEINSLMKEIINADDLGDRSYEEIVRIMTVCQYITDLAIKEIEDRDMLTFYEGAPIIPDARPESMYVENILTRDGDYAYLS